MKYFLLLYFIIITSCTAMLLRREKYVPCLNGWSYQNCNTT